MYFFSANIHKICQYPAGLPVQVPWCTLYVTSASQHRWTRVAKPCSNFFLVWLMTVKLGIRCVYSGRQGNSCYRNMDRDTYVSFHLPPWPLALDDPDRSKQRVGTTRRCGGCSYGFVRANTTVLVSFMSAMILNVCCVTGHVHVTYPT